MHVGTCSDLASRLTYPTFAGIAGMGFVALRPDLVGVAGRSADPV
jgi:hypothetical protein